MNFDLFILEDMKTRRVRFSNEKTAGLTSQIQFSIFFFDNKFLFLMCFSVIFRQRQPKSNFSYITSSSQIIFRCEASINCRWGTSPRFSWEETCQILKKKIIFFELEGKVKMIRVQAVNSGCATRKLQSVWYVLDVQREYIQYGSQIMKEDMEARAQELDPTRSKTIGSYVIGKTLGKGTFGKVKSAVHLPTGQKVAVKILQKEKIVDVADVERVSREIHILKLIRHPGIIQLYEIIETPKQLFLIMEYMEGGELFDYIVKSKKISEDEACTIFQQLIGGIEYIHKLNIVHRDLKPQNLLIDYDKSIRLVDFGLSNTYRKEQRLKTACGSPCYAAPEMIEGKNRYEPIMVDIWSSGVILYAMLCGCLPFQDPQTSKLYQKILSGEYKVPKHLSEDAKDILARILSVDPNKRLRIEDIRKHRWWNLSTVQPSTQGIIVGYHRIPVEDPILEETVKLGFERNFTKKCIEANRHNDATTTYFLLLKKFVREGGISKTFLGSKYFDPALIEPIRRVPLESAINFDQTAPNFNPRETSTEKNSSSHPGIGRKTYHLGNPTRRLRDLSKGEDSLDRNNRFRQLYTPSNKLGHSLKARDQRTISLEKSSHETVTKTGKETIPHPGYDQISRKYRQTYGVPLVSRSKDKSNSKRKSLKKYELTDIYEKTEMNKTLVAYNRTGKAKSNRIGVDKGFQSTLNTIDNIYRKPYANRRFIYH